MKKSLALILSLALCLPLCACGGDAQPSPSGSASPSPSDSASPSPSVSVSGEVDLSRPVFEYASGIPNSDPAVTVNGSPLSADLYCYWLSNYCYYIDSSYAMYGMSADFTDQDMADALKGYARDVLVYCAAIQSLCEENSVTLTQEQLTQFQTSLEETAAEAGVTLENLLWEYGLSEENLRSMSLASELRENLMDALVTPTQADLAQYTSDVNAFSCKHILLLTADEDQTDADGNVTQTAQEYNAERRALAEDLLKQLRSAADPEALLDELAEEYSEDGRGTDGHLASPDGYTFSDSDSLVDGFREATLAVEPGELTGVVETSYGYHIILRLPLDSSSFLDEYRDATLETILSAEVDRSEVTMSDAVQALNVAEFYERYVAWQSAWADEYFPQSSQG